MRYAEKSKQAAVRAYPLGAGHPMEAQLLQEGAIHRLPDGNYELFSREAVSGRGQIARPGDYFKVDTDHGKHFPYPNAREFFLENHVRLEGDTYIQKSKPLMIWQAGDEPNEVLRWLLDTGRLTLDPGDPAHYFRAFLWNAPLSAAMDATLVFYRVDRDTDGAITDVHFNFVEKTEFEANYTLL